MSDETTYQPEPEDDPTAIDPDEQLEAEPGDEELPEDEFLTPEVARDDDTVDDQEHDEVERDE